MLGPGMPRNDEAEDFIEKVDEVSRLIEGLQAGKISPDYIDNKYLNKPKAETQAAPSRTQTTSGPGSLLTKAAVEDQNDQSDAKCTEEDEKKERLMNKVRELQANRERKLQARLRYEQYVQSESITAGTDYMKWDMWCPEDEEDDLYNSLTPNNPGFKALEKDIDDRHRRMVEQRQLAERQRVAGNAAFKSGQYSEALRCYQAGVEAEKTNMALHANAAQAALKISCYVQAVEHCNKVMSIAEFLHNNPKHELCVKALMRRSLAHLSLGQHTAAAQDIATALDIMPNDKDLVAVKAKIDSAVVEHKKQKEIRKALEASNSQQQQQQALQASSGKDTADQGNKGSSNAASSHVLRGIDLSKLQLVERLVQALKKTQADSVNLPAPGASQATASTGHNCQHGPKLPQKGKFRSDKSDDKDGHSKNSGEKESSPAARLKALLDADDQCCVYFRECGGVDAAAQEIMQHVRNLSTTDQSPLPGGNVAELLRLLDTAAMNDGNIVHMLNIKGFFKAVLSCIALPDHGTLHAAAALACSVVTNQDARKAFSKLLDDSKCKYMEATISAFTAASDTQLIAVLLQFLGNCATDAACKAALQRCLTAPMLDTFLHKLTAQLKTDVSTVLVDRACTLFTNMCGSEQLRLTLGASKVLTQKLLSLFLQDPKHGTACTAASNALFNLTAQPCSGTVIDTISCSQHVVGVEGTVLNLIQCPDLLIASRAAALLARCMKHKETLSKIQNLDGLAKIVATIQEHLVSKQSNEGKSSSDESNSRAQIVDALVRCVTLYVSDVNTAQALQQYLSSQGPACMHQVLASPHVTSSTAGNAALAIANTAIDKSVLAVYTTLCKEADTSRSDEDAEPRGVPDLQEAQHCLIAALIKTAYGGQGTVVAKNAGIALARLAAHPPLLARLKQLRGLEIIHATVKSL